MTKFDGNDYHIWAFSMMKYLGATKLWEVVSGEWQRPVIPPPNIQVFQKEHLDEYGDPWTIKDVEYWDDLNINAETILLQSVGKLQQQSLTECHSAYEMWLKLESIYQQSSKTNKRRLLLEYNNYHQKRGQ
jgi:gag-polypeptide of LTR copia-type